MRKRGIKNERARMCKRIVIEERREQTPGEIKRVREIERESECMSVCRVRSRMKIKGLYTHRQVKNEIHTTLVNE